MPWRVWLTFAALGVIWGLPYFFIKLAVTEVSPLMLAFCRIAMAAAVLLPIAWRRGSLRGLSKRKAPIAAFALCEFAVPFTAIGLGERQISSSVAGIMIAMVPLIVALLQRLVGMSEPMPVWRVAGLTLGFAGVAGLLGTGPIAYPLGWVGVAWIFLATVGYSIGPLIVQRYFVDLDAIGPLAVSLGVAAVVLAIPAAYQWPSQLPSATALVSIVVLGLICTAVAMLLMFSLIRAAGAARAAVITYINPVVATLLGIVVLHESLGVGGAVAFATILLGSWLATRGAV